MRCWSTQCILQTFDAACKAHYECNSYPVSSPNVELMTHINLKFKKFSVATLTSSTLIMISTKIDSRKLRVMLDRYLWTQRVLFQTFWGSAPSIPQLHAALPTTSSISSISPQRPIRKSSLSARRRELVWKSQQIETVSLEEIENQFQSCLLTFSSELGLNRRRGRYTTKTAHRCPGYNHIEITLTPDIARSAIVSHLTPIPHEICPVCKEVVKDAEIFACICGRDGKSGPACACPFFLFFVMFVLTFLAEITNPFLL